MTYRAALRTIAVIVLLASCALPRPGIELSISGTSVASSREGSYCQSGGCSGTCADGPAPVAPLTRVRAGAPIRLDFSAGPEVSEIDVSIYEGERTGATPRERFTLSGRERSFTSSVMRSGTYYISVLIRWSRFTDRGDAGRSFLVELSPP